MDNTTTRESVKPQLDVVEPREIQDGCVVENTEIPLDNAEGNNTQLEDLPQKVKKLKTGILRFFSCVLRTLKCCCCCVSVETD
ncbi:hypothetical protein AAFF_G00341950 [Aldrovandia affinis]|uniref:Uncharacterized protein n=1 Tax=Aldrovandia affinis TaxID=143900 RepID=A0AAD7SLW6_9TELE|nr:hypothetical protein AAFF_G00341950 [Aldrovandia affinis]